ncbi:Hypothetical protein A7982_02339 [Minicystis rosea]|nr:Hypothetical protein A7982_02339 [Minicystis rosea]
MTAADASRPEPHRTGADPRPLLARLFGADPRSLAAFRIALGGALLVDLAQRAPDLRAHYTDLGILPRADLPRFTLATLPLHRLGGAPWATALLFFIAAVAAAALLAGYRTRLAAFVSWALLLSLHDRNRLVLDGGDGLLRIMLFWGMLVPLGERWSIDAARAPQRPPDDRPRTSIAVTALLVQIASMYLFTGLLKIESPSWRHGDALHLALLTEQMQTPLGAALLDHPTLVTLLSHGAVWLEIIGPLALFSPWATDRIRAGSLAGFVLLQLGIGLSMTIGNFQSSATVMLLPLVPASLWNRLPPLPERLVSAVRARLVRHHARPPTALHPGLARAMEALAGTVTVYLFISNVASLFTPNLPDRFVRPAFVLGLDQRWDMFVLDPVAGRRIGWTVIPATLDDGRTVDLLTGNDPVQWTKPGRPSELYGRWRWRSYQLWTLWRKTAPRPLYAAWLCRRWDDAHPEGPHVRSLQIVLMRGLTREDLTVSPPVPQKLWEGPCPQSSITVSWSLA